MFKSPFLLFFSLTVLFFTACNSHNVKESEEHIQIPNNFKTLEIDSLTIFACPKEMLQVENLRLAGDFQFADLINVRYAVVQIDPKESNNQTDLKSFFSAKLDDLTLKMVGPVSNEAEQFSINDIKGYSKEIDANVYGWPRKLHYWISVVELKDKFVTNIVWTTEDKVKDFEMDAEVIVKSFRKI